MKAEIVTIGTELLLGAIHDTNATHIAAELNKIGVDVLYRSTVGDNEQRIADIIRQALERVDVVLTTGGLGPTLDDVTRQAVSTATDRPLEFHQVLYDEIAERFHSRGYRLSENNRRQAYVPKGATIVRNPIGTAPTFILESDGGTVMVMPGVPREMKLLLETEMIPWLREHMDEPAAIVSKTLHTAGIGESRIDEILGEILLQANPTVGLAAHTGQTSVRIVAKAASEKAAQVLIDPTAKVIKQKLGPWVYGDEQATIEQAMVEAVGQYQAGVAIVEFGSTGIVEERLMHTPNDLPGQAYLKRPDINVNQKDYTDILVAVEAVSKLGREAAQADYGAALGVWQDTDRPEGFVAAFAISWDGDQTSRKFGWDAEKADLLEWSSTHFFANLRKAILEQHGEEFIAAR